MKQWKKKTEHAVLPTTGKADWLVRQIMENCNYMRMVLIFVYLCYLLFLILMGSPTEMAYYYWLGFVLFLIGWMKYTGMTEVWSNIKTAKNITYGLLPFPIDRRELTFSHIKGIFWTELLLGVIAYVDFMCWRGSLLPQKQDVLLLLYVLLFPLIIVGLRDGIRRNRGKK